jgi:hypothetical protein
MEASIAVLALGGGAIGLQLAFVLPALLVVGFGWLHYRVGFAPATVARSTPRDLTVSGLPFLGWDALIRFRPALSLWERGQLLPSPRGRGVGGEGRRGPPAASAIGIS